ncbi:hypothetical protein NUW54_g11749 [Trametes sanguinea]|uniref:Uncharacterized protein n=1 Tax=Trametes sanguinea TaxID=158606 RepID=A0ACC1N8Y1_9APHY|nr:hypothetical protein NUW54_g11749 [Trametes sanguinea]
MSLPVLRAGKPKTKEEPGVVITESPSDPRLTLPPRTPQVQKGVGCGLEGVGRAMDERREARRVGPEALWQDGMNYLHGTGHGVGSFLNVHEGPQSFSSDVPLQVGHVLTNEPGFCTSFSFGRRRDRADADGSHADNEGKWGIRIESALVVRKVHTKGSLNNNETWLGFERLTCVPIQTKMVKEVMLSKEERQWLKDHNRRCLEMLEPLIRHDKRAMKYLRREAERGIGIAGAGPGGLTIDWD